MMVTVAADIYTHLLCFSLVPRVETKVKAHLHFSNLTFTLQQSNLKSAAGSPQQEEGNQLFLVNETNQTCKILFTQNYLQSLLNTFTVLGLV